MNSMAFTQESRPATGIYELRDQSGHLLLSREGRLFRGMPNHPGERLAVFIPPSQTYCLVYTPCGDHSSAITFHLDHLPTAVQAFNIRVDDAGWFTLDLPASGYRLADLDQGMLGAAGLEVEAVSWRFEPALRAPTPWLDPLLDRVGSLSAQDAAAELLALKDPAGAPLVAALLRLLSDDAVVALEPAIHASGYHGDLFAAIRLTTSRYQPVPYNRTRLILAPGIAQYGWDVGEHSYGAPIVMEAEHGAHLKIGRYCQIASDVVFVLGNHRMGGASAYPFSSLHPWWPSCLETGGRTRLHNHVPGDITVGSDVWIGLGATVMPGTTIGDGAVIGARAVVGGHVPAYAVVVGSPKRILRKRFDDTTIERLLRLRWWDWDDHDVDRYTQLLMDQDISRFLDKAEADLGLPALVMGGQAPSDEDSAGEEVQERDVAVVAEPEPTGWWSKLLEQPAHE